jgi:hypothetical protein
MLDLYYGLLAKNGVTARMLSEACEQYVMAQSKDGRGKFYPDPGQLYDLCRHEAAARVSQKRALEHSRNILVGGGKPEGQPKNNAPRDFRAALAALKSGMEQSPPKTETAATDAPTTSVSPELLEKVNHE